MTASIGQGRPQCVGEGDEHRASVDALRQREADDRGHDRAHARRPDEAEAHAHRKSAPEAVQRRGGALPPGKSRDARGPVDQEAALGARARRMTTPKATRSTIAAIRSASGEHADGLHDRGEGQREDREARHEARDDAEGAAPCRRPTLPESTMGSTGRMQGESIVITPERNAKARSTGHALTSPSGLDVSVLQDHVHAAAVPDRDPGRPRVDLHVGVLRGHPVAALEVGRSCRSRRRRP